MKQLHGWHLFIFLAWGLIGSALADAAPKTSGDKLVVPQYQIEVTPLAGSEAASTPLFQLNKHMSLTVRLKPLIPTPDPVLGIRFDARMPAHKHGMVTKAKVKQIPQKDPGVYEFQVDGVRLHMAGAWLLSFTIQQKQDDTLVEVPYQLAP